MLAGCSQSNLVAVAIVDTDGTAAYNEDSASQEGRAVGKLVDSAEGH